MTTALAARLKSCPVARFLVVRVPPYKNNAEKPVTGGRSADFSANREGREVSLPSTSPHLESQRYVYAGKPEKSAEETTGENLQRGHRKQGCVSSGDRRFHGRQDQRYQRMSYRRRDRGCDHALGVRVIEHCLKLGDGFVVQPVAGAAGGLVREKRDKNRHAERNHHQSLQTSPHRPISMCRRAVRGQVT